MSDEVYDRLVKAGAPELPPGYFYRVRDEYGSNSGNYVFVEVRKRSSFWLAPSVGVASACASRAYNIRKLSPVQLVAEAATKAWAEVVKKRCPHWASEFFGDHP